MNLQQKAVLYTIHKYSKLSFCKFKRIINLEWFTETGSRNFLICLINWPQQVFKPKVIAGSGLFGEYDKFVYIQIQRQSSFTPAYIGDLEHEEPLNLLETPSNAATSPGHTSEPERSILAYATS